MFRKFFGPSCENGRRPRRDPRPGPAARRGRQAPRLEVLEPRTAPAVNVFLSGGVLFAVGDAAADTITIDHSGSATTVTRSAPAPFTLTFPDNSFTRIEIDPGAGPFGDTVNIRAILWPTSVTST